VPWETIRIEVAEIEFNTLERVEDIAWKKYIKLMDENDKEGTKCFKELIKRKFIERK
jgi:hypothetical protein